MIITLGPWEISVTFESATTLGDNYGDWCISTKSIRVLEGLPPLDSCMTLIHEFFHAISDLHYLRLSEQSVRALENTIATLVQSNPDLAYLLVEGLSGSPREPASIPPEDDHATTPRRRPGDGDWKHDPASRPSELDLEAPEGRRERLRDL